MPLPGYWPLPPPPRCPGIPRRYGLRWPGVFCSPTLSLPTGRSRPSWPRLQRRGRKAEISAENNFSELFCGQRTHLRKQRRGKRGLANSAAARRLIVPPRITKGLPGRESPRVQINCLNPGPANSDRSIPGLISWALQGSTLKGELQTSPSHP